MGKNRGFVYLHAVDEKGTPTKVTPDLLKADVLLPYNFEKDQPPQWCGWFARITASRLISRAKLIEKHLLDETLLTSKTSFYYVLEFQKTRDLDPSLLRKVEAIIPPVRGIPIAKSWESLTLP